MKKFIVYSKNFTCDLLSICFHGEDLQEAKNSFLTNLETMILSGLPNHYYLLLAAVDLTDEQLAILDNIVLDTPIPALFEFCAEQPTEEFKLIEAISASETISIEALSSFESVMLPLYHATQKASGVFNDQEPIDVSSRAVKAEAVKTYIAKYYN